MPTISSLNNSCLLFLQNVKNIVANTLLSGGNVLNKVNKTTVGTGGDQVMVNISNFSNVPLSNPPGISISLGGMSNNNIGPITSTGMPNNVLNPSGMLDLKLPSMISNFDFTFCKMYYVDVETRFIIGSFCFTYSNSRSSCAEYSE